MCLNSIATLLAFILGTLVGILLAFTLGTLVGILPLIFKAALFPVTHKLSSKSINNVSVRPQRTCL